MEILGAVSLAAWLGLLLLPGRPWNLQPRAEDGHVYPGPPRWATVCILVPALNEAELLPQTVPTLLAQDYPGRFRVVEHATARHAPHPAQNSRPGRLSRPQDRHVTAPSTAAMRRE
jgi:cellulose synthase/poly-beta-1,6-N-acetylglucosamine synthase-like glycosyltransferase